MQTGVAEGFRLPDFKAFYWDQQPVDWTIIMFENNANFTLQVFLETHVSILI